MASQLTLETTETSHILYIFLQPDTGFDLERKYLPLPLLWKLLFEALFTKLSRAMAGGVLVSCAQLTLYWNIPPEA